MAQFTRVNQMIGADLNTSLQEFFTVIEASGGILLEELKTALGPTVSNSGSLQSPMSRRGLTTCTSTCPVTKVLVFLDCARREGCYLLEDLVKSLQTDEETQEAAHCVIQMDFSFRGPHLGLGSIQGVS